MLRTAMAGIFVVLTAFPFISQARYFTFNESQSGSFGWSDPREMMQSLARASINLLAWVEQNAERPEPNEKYDRLEHFGTWVNDPRTPDCLDTRAVVLVRDSQVEVSMSRGNPCRVYAGYWADPYTGKDFKLARDIQVDHVVPLKNAYVSGASNWDSKHRCLYANFLGFRNHLMPISGVENSSKGDSGPEEWMPTMQNYSCQYLQNWLVIKFVWRLNMSEEEAQGILEEIRRNKCDARFLQYSSAEIQRVRRFAAQNLELCTFY